MWAVLAAVALGLDVAGIPYSFAFYQETCTGAGCEDSGRLTPEGVRAVQEFGLSPEFYAAYVGVGLSTLVTLVFFALATVIFWRRSENRMALFRSFLRHAQGRDEPGSAKRRTGRGSERHDAARARLAVVASRDGSTAPAAGLAVTPTISPRGAEERL